MKEKSQSENKKKKDSTSEKYNPALQNPQAENASESLGSRKVELPEDPVPIPRDVERFQQTQIPPIKRRAQETLSGVDIDPLSLNFSQRLAIEMIGAAKEGDDKAVQDLISQGADINFPHPRSGFTALHYAAAREAKWVLKALTKKPELNYLVKDKKGRLPSMLAFEVAENSEIGTFLMKREIRQAKRQGTDYRAIISGEI